jgi:hypothetical protein
MKHKLTKIEKALIILAEEIESLPYCEYKVRKIILDCLEIEDEIKKPKFT